MALMEKLDDFIIEQGFQPFSDWFYQETDKTNYWLARVFARLDFLLYSCFAVLMSYILLAVHAYLLSSLVWVQTCYLGYRMFRKLAAMRNIEAYHKANPLVVNPLRRFEVGGPSRMMGLALVLVYTAFAVYSGGFFLLVLLTAAGLASSIEDYFLACVLKPRKRKEVKVRVPMGALPQGA